MKLREYQERGVNALRKSIMKGCRRPVCCLPTGGGKTVIAGEIIRSAIEKKKKVLFLAPRRELIYQASGALDRFGIRHGIIMAGERISLMHDVQVASFDTLDARAMRTRRMDLPPADVVIVDEAHLSIAKKKLALLRRYDKAVVIGLTATPARGDGRGLGEYYDDLVEFASMRDLIGEGFLVDADYYAPTKPDLEGIKVRGGDYIVGGEHGIAHRMDTPKLVGDIYKNWRRIAADKQTVIFCCTRKHARHVHREFLRKGVRAEYLDGNTDNDDRKDILYRISSGESQVLVNVFVATFGLDIPSLECAVIARPTKSLVLYLQTVGRVLRPFPGKERAIVIDHAGAVDEHGYVTDDQPWSLDDSRTVADRKKETKANTPKDITCTKCGKVFRGRRDCPACGHQLIPASAPVPYHDGVLQKIAKKDNRETPWEEKMQFMAELRLYCGKHGKKDGWAAHKYKDKFGVWPNDTRVRDVEPASAIRPETASWIRSRNIAYAKRRTA